MKISIKQILMLIIVFIIILITLPSIDSINIPLPLFALLSLIGIISTLEIVKCTKKYSYSLDMMHWIFILFFFCIAPIIQIANDFHPWGIVLSTSEEIKSCIFILI